IAFTTRHLTFRMKNSRPATEWTIAATGSKADRPPHAPYVHRFHASAWVPDTPSRSQSPSCSMTRDEKRGRTHRRFHSTDECGLHGISLCGGSHLARGARPLRQVWQSRPNVTIGGYQTSVTRLTLASFEMTEKKYLAPGKRH
ncbi:MAG TPA: hypothetical protein VHO91_01065, partial [Rhodopila sp.]|nr:hypothetical protein [Rhodopila sp.]